MNRPAKTFASLLVRSKFPLFSIAKDAFLFIVLDKLERDD
tara:strand:- start:2859 stop:2978 length:120 start_codon:yes stop_codon:yes gene_type:complete